MNISVITICYNSEACLALTIESVLNQRYNDFEYILIDGLSTDGTVGIIKKYEPLFNGRLKWISEPDEGLYDALNKGLRMATGEIVGLVHSDDFFSSPDILLQVADAFDTCQTDAVYGDVQYVSKSDPDKVLRKYSSRIFKRPLMLLGFMPAHPSFYIKRSCLETYGLYNTSYKIGADFELLLRYIFIHRIRIVYLPVCFVTMRLGGISTKGISSYTTIMREHIRACRENGVFTNRLLLSLRYLYKLTELRFW